MITPQFLLKLWAPPQSPWSAWVKPALIVQLLDKQMFVKLEDMKPVTLEVEPPPAGLAPIDPNASTTHIAIVIDLPGAEAVRTGLALARTHGCRPIPLFNGCAGEAEIVPTGALRQALIEAAPQLASLQLADDAPPAFLLERGRLPAQPAFAPGQFDNRWVVFAQDFPSANFLRNRGITHVLLIQPKADWPPQEDLSHVLLRWQEDGMVLSVLGAEAGRFSPSQPLRVARPSAFRALWQPALALLGLRRNNAGGFGSMIPPASAG